MNAPSMPVCSTSRKMSYSFTRSVIAFHDDRIAMNPIIVVSRISSVLRPSTPRKYSAPIDGIHGARSTNWNSAPCGLYQNHSGTEIGEADERR